MNVVILSDHLAEGGAATATRRIALSIAQKNQCGWYLHPTHRVAFFDEPCGFDACPSRHVLWYEETERKRYWMRPLRKLFPSRFPHPHTPEFAAQRLRNKLAELNPELINVHNLHAAAPWGWGPHLVDVCLEFAPVVWTLHDMWSFTGRCAYSYDCEKFIAGCDASCPTPTEAPALPPEQIQAAWQARQTIYAQHRDKLVVVTPSRWLADQARRGLFAGHRVEVIPYGVVHPYEEFVRLPCEECRRDLGINPAGPVLLLAAFDLTERRKGAGILPQLWRHIEHRPLTVVTMGKGEIAVDDPLIEVHRLGWIDEDAKKAKVYSAADALLHPAPVDNFPNIVLEAMTCSTPTIAMPVGGLPEMVRPGVSGWLAESATPAALGAAVDRAIGELSLGKSMRESCRELAEKEYSLELQGRRYYELFQALTTKPQQPVI
jgi:glycosyltransferase involved in cell wall biosynthesis